MHRLTALREIRKKQVEEYFANCNNHVITLGEDRKIIDAFSQLQSLAPQIGPASSTYAANPHFRQIYQSINERLAKYIQRFGYDELYIVDNVSKRIVFSLRLTGDFGKAIDEAPLRQTKLRDLCEKLQQMKTQDTAVISDFAWYPYAPRVPVAFIGTPLISHGKNLGSIVIRITGESINNIMTSNKNWIEEGFGATGETYLVGSDYLMRSDSRFYIANGKRLADSSAYITAFSPSILKRKVYTESTIDAMRGKTDTRIIRDYRNVEVLSSYTKISTAGLNWVILAEIDTREAFSSVYSMRESLLLITLIMILLATFLAVLIARVVTRPLITLIRAAEQYSRGNLSFRTALNSRDEFEVLGNTLNTMAENLENSRARLTNEIEAHKETEAELVKAKDEFRNLSTHLQTAREEERKSIAREIHDDMGQWLNTMKIKLFLLKDEQPGEHDQVLNEAISVVDAIIKSVKRLITNLRPQVLDDLGLVPAIEWLVNDFRNTTGIPTVCISNTDDIQLSGDRAISVFRIIQEALTNISRHAKATEVHVYINNSPRVCIIRVSDNGTGMQVTEVDNGQSFGILGMRERALYCGGKLEIESQPTRGTQVVLTIPKEKK